MNSPNQLTGHATEVFHEETFNRLASAVLAKGSRHELSHGIAIEVSAQPWSGPEAEATNSYFHYNIRRITPLDHSDWFAIEDFHRASNGRLVNTNFQAYHVNDAYVGDTYRMDVSSIVYSGSIDLIQRIGIYLDCQTILDQQG